MARDLKFRKVEGLYYLYVPKTKVLINSAPLFSYMQNSGFFMMQIISYVFVTFQLNDKVVLCPIQPMLY